MRTHDTSTVDTSNTTSSNMERCIASSFLIDPPGWPTHHGTV